MQMTKRKKRGHKTTKKKRKAARERERAEKEKVRGNFSCCGEFGVNQLSYANTCQVV